MAERAPFGTPIEQHRPVFALRNDESPFQAAIEPGDITRFVGVRGMLSLQRLRLVAANQQRQQGNGDQTRVHDRKASIPAPPAECFIGYSNVSALLSLT